MCMNSIDLKAVLKMNKKQICQKFPQSMSSVVWTTGNEPVNRDIAIVVNVRKSLISEKKSLHDAAREKWKIKRRQDNALLSSNSVRYVIPVYCGLILEVYDITAKPQYDSQDCRWTFNDIAPTKSTIKKTLIGTHLQHILPRQMHNPVFVLI